MTQQKVHESIWDKIHRKRFYLAEQAPICQCFLRGDFGYTACSPTAKNYSREVMSIQRGLNWQHANSKKNVHGYTRQCQNDQFQQLSEDRNGKNDGKKQRKTPHHQYLAFILDITKLGINQKLFLNFMPSKQASYYAEDLRSIVGIMDSQ